jgi:hypothetical protein
MISSVAYFVQFDQAANIPAGTEYPRIPLIYHQLALSDIAQLAEMLLLSASKWVLMFRLTVTPTLARWMMVHTYYDLRIRASTSPLFNSGASRALTIAASLFFFFFGGWEVLPNI